MLHAQSARPPDAAQDRLKAYGELAKPRITALLVLVAAASFALALGGSPAGGPGLLRGLLVTAVTVGALAGGIFSLNHLLERRQDGLMMRTRRRPLPSRRLSPREALWFGMGLTVLAIGFSAAAANLLTAGICILIAAGYLLVYTPLKYRTPLHTALGALPGAAPPLVGWSIARGQLDENAWILFAILLLWQFPHFLSIEMMYREDYERAGVRVFPVLDHRGRSVVVQIVLSCLLLTGVSLLPALTGLSRGVYPAGALLLGLAFLGVAVRAAATRRKEHMRHLLRASVLYLPLLFTLLLAAA